MIFSVTPFIVCVLLNVITEGELFKYERYLRSERTLTRLNQWKLVKRTDCAPGKSLSIPAK